MSRLSLIDRLQSKTLIVKSGKMRVKNLKYLMMFIINIEILIQV
jgi:hypothetical protein